GKFTRLLEEKGIKVYNIDTSRTFRLDSAFRLAEVIKKEGVGLIDSHAPLSGTILSRLSGWISGVPVINHNHCPEFINLNPFIGSLQSALLRITSRLFCGRIIAVSEFVKREIIKQGAPADKVTVIYNGIDLDNAARKESRVKIRSEFGLNENRPIIAEVGRLGNDKGQHILIQAAPYVIEKFPDAMFMIVGEDLGKKGEYRRELEAMAAGLGIEDKIIFTGYRTDIMDLMEAFDLFVLPSVFTEGLPVVIMEAMLAKKPVIAASVGGSPEIVLDARTGTLVPPADPGRLAEAIIYHLSNPGISKQMAENGYELLKQRFSLKQMLDKTMEIYQELMESPRG
ncbi:MAG: glycosyltransferase, partial [Thermodesulfobacteriota bacterium]